MDGYTTQHGMAVYAQRCQQVNICLGNISVWCLSSVLGWFNQVITSNDVREMEQCSLARICPKISIRTPQIELIGLLTNKKQNAQLQLNCLCL